LPASQKSAASALNQSLTDFFTSSWLHMLCSAQTVFTFWTTVLHLLWSRDMLTTFTHGAEPFLRSHQLCGYSGISQHFMEPDGSLPCSQEPSTGPYAEPDKSNLAHPISRRFTLILSTHLRLGIPSGPFPYGFLTNILHKFIFPTFVLRALPI
jgi:hypothetical protein